MAPKERLLHLRQRLQKFLQAADRGADEAAKAAEKLAEVEEWQLEVNLFRETKIGKVIKHLAKAEPALVDHDISARCQKVRLCAGQDRERERVGSPVC